MKKFCKKHGNVKHYIRVEGGYRCSSCAKESVTKRRKTLKAKAVDYKGGRCKICSGSFSYAVFSFHHRDPELKEFKIASANKSWETIKTELDKCDMLCANCHMTLHFN